MVLLIPISGVTCPSALSHNSLFLIFRPHKEVFNFLPLFFKNVTATPVSSVYMIASNSFSASSKSTGAVFLTVILFNLIFALH